MIGILRHHRVDPYPIAGHALFHDARRSLGHLVRPAVPVADRLVFHCPFHISMRVCGSTTTLKEALFCGIFLGYARDFHALLRYRLRCRVCFPSRPFTSFANSSARIVTLCLQTLCAHPQAASVPHQCLQTRLGLVGEQEHMTAQRIASRAFRDPNQPCRFCFGQGEPTLHRPTIR
jgi:hypothetical protein